MSRYKTRSSTSLKFDVVISLIVLVLVSSLCFIETCLSYTTGRSVEHIQVKKLVENKDEYLIFTEGSEVFENSDALLYGKFDSSDVQAELQNGKCYRVIVFGYRIRLFSMYRNVLEAQEEECKK